MDTTHNWSVSKLLENAAEEWSLPKPAVGAVMIVPFLVMMSGAFSALLGKESYKWFTGEDGLAETLQVILYVAAFALCLVVLRHCIRQQNVLMAALYGCLCCGFFFMIGEETSWGQRLIGWESPDAFKVNNKQEETNLHNIHGVGSTFKWIQLLVGMYGTILPLAVCLAAKSSFVTRHRRFIDMVVPHYSLIPYFLLLFVWRVYRNLFEAPTDYYFVIAEYNEVLELVLALGFVLFLVFQLRSMGKQVSFAPTRRKYST